MELPKSRFEFLATPMHLHAREDALRGDACVDGYRRETASSKLATGRQRGGGSTGTQSRHTTTSDSNNLSSKVALKAPALPDGAPALRAAADASSRMAFLILPLIPDTVLICAPSNFAASSADVNIPAWIDT